MKLGAHKIWNGGMWRGHDELPELARQKALEKYLGIKDQSCPVLRLSQKTVGWMVFLTSWRLLHAWCWAQ